MFTIGVDISHMTDTVKRKIIDMGDPKDIGFGERLKRAIHESPWRTQKAFAQAVDIHEQTISQYAQGQVPRGQEIVKLAMALPGQVEWILTGKEGKRPYRAKGSEVRAALNDILDQMPDPVVERILWQLEALRFWAKTDDQATMEHFREVRGE